MSKQVKTVGMLLALSALPMGAVYAGNVTSPTAVQNVQAEGECKGVVLDATGEPMIGASVVVKGKSGLGTVTDIDGNFTLRNVKKGETLRITSIGMTPVEVVYKGLHSLIASSVCFFFSVSECKSLKLSCKLFAVHVC